MNATDPLSILFVVPQLRGGGAEFVSWTWMEWLASEGHTVSVVTTSERADPLSTPEGVEVYTVAGGRSHLAKVRGVKDMFDIVEADLVVSMQSYANLVLIAARLLAGRNGPPIVVSERNIVALGLPGSGSVHRSKAWLARRLYRRADHVIAVSHPTGGELVAGFGVRGDRLTVVANPATAKIGDHPRTNGARRPAARLQLVLPCRLVDQKRPQLAIRTAAELARRGIAAEVVAFGDGPLLEELTAVAQEAAVEFVHHGWVDEWFTQIGPSSVVLLPSFREGFGNVLVEAAAVGVPSVAVSGALGVADAVIPGITGELAPTDDPTDLADAVIRASALDLDGIGPWLDRFSAEASGRSILRVFDIVLTRDEAA